MAQLPASWIGTTLNGRYHIEALLGQGGMSTVYRATDPNLQRRVAVKIIHPHLTADPQFRQRFEQEATAVARLRHPNIVQVHDFDHHDGVTYMVLEYIAGETLAQKLQTLHDDKSHMLPAQCIRVLTDLCLAVEYAHQRGMIHCDLKPANVMINRLGEPVLMDFGIARLRGSLEEHEDAEALGTAHYMAPEQIQGKPVDHRADIYALGVLLYEMLESQPPFTGQTAAEIMARHLQEPVPPLGSQATAVPETLVAIIHTAMAKDPAHRYQSATAMATALQSVGLALQQTTEPLGARHLEHLNRLLQQAQTAVANHHDLVALEKLEEIERTGAEFAPEQVANLRQTAQARLYERTVQLFQSGQFDDSLILVTRLQALSLDWPNLAHLETQIRQAQKTTSRQTDLDTLYDTAVAYLERGDYAAALACWETIEQQRGPLAFTDHLQVARQARAGLCADLAAQAQTAVHARQPEEALRLWAQIEATDPHYPDTSGVVKQAQDLLRQQHNSWQRRLVYLVPLLLMMLLAAAWLGRSRQSASSTPPPLATNPAAIALPTETTPPTSPPTAVPTAPGAPSQTAAAPPSPVPTATARLSATPPPATSLPTLPANTAVVLEAASIFTAPQANSQELSVVAPGEQVQVLGRAEVRNWLFVDNGQVAGFIFQPLVQWPGDVSALPVYTYTDAAPPTATPPPGGGSAPLRIDLWTLANTAQCSSGRWSQRVFIQGQGGNGRYRYYWQDQLLAGPIAGSHTFTVSSSGGVVIGVGRVVSGDGQAAERELFIPIPRCPAGP